MQVIIPFNGGSLNGKKSLICEPFLYRGLYEDTVEYYEIYKLITVGQCKIPLRYKFIGIAKPVGGIIYDT